MRKENLLLIIDMQNDFCLPTGALYVPGAEEDVKTLSKFIGANVQMLDEIILTQDNHRVIDISHPKFWINNKGQNPKPFTQILPEDIRKGEWKPKYYIAEATTYINSLYMQGEYPHIIWPEHCIAESNGAAIVEELMDVLKAWTSKGRYFEVVTKGLNPKTEHFGALRANIPVSTDEKTQTNEFLVAKLKEYKNIFIAGEAKSHCVANTIKQICEIEGIAEKLIILEDTMSDVPGFEELADPIYKQALSQGAQFETTDNFGSSAPNPK